MPSFTSAMPCSTFSRVTQFMRPRWSSGPNSPQLEPGGLFFQLASVVMPPEPFGDQHRLVRAFALDHGVPGHLHAAVADLLELRSVKRARTREPLGTGEVKRTRFRP